MARKTIKPKAGAWFIPLRGSYLPATMAGWLTYIPFLAYLVFSLEVSLQQTNTLSMAVLYIVPNWVAAAVAMTWLAKAKS